MQESFKKWFRLLCEVQLRLKGKSCQGGVVGSFGPETLRGLITITQVYVEAKRRNESKACKCV